MTGSAGIKPASNDCQVESQLIHFNRLLTVPTFAARRASSQNTVARNCPPVVPRSGVHTGRQTMAVSRPQTQVPEALRWGIHTPNPPDPAWASILEFAPPSWRQALLTGCAGL